MRAEPSAEIRENDFFAQTAFVQLAWDCSDFQEGREEEQGAATENTPSPIFPITSHRNNTKLLVDVNAAKATDRLCFRRHSGRQHEKGGEPRVRSDAVFPSPSISLSLSLSVMNDIYTTLRVRPHRAIRRTDDVTRRLISHLSFQRETTSAVQQPTAEQVSRARPAARPRMRKIACRQLPVGACPRLSAGTDDETGRDGKQPRRGRGG